jgi:hypothetical protein
VTLIRDITDIKILKISRYNNYVENFHHKNIKRFNLSGVIHDDSAIDRLRGEYVRLLISEMRLSGYVPKFEIEPDFTIDYNIKKQSFEFELTLYGIHVGKRKSEWIEGLYGTRAIFTQKSKSKEFSQDQV